MSLHDQTIGIAYPPDMAREIALLFDGLVPGEAAPGDNIAIVPREGGRFGLTGAGEPLDDLSREEVFVHALDRIVHGLIVKMDSATALHAGAVTWNGATVLVAGPTGAGKTSVVAWLADRGFGFLTDELVVAAEAGARLVPLPRALVAKAANAAAIASLPAYRDAGTVPAGAGLAIRPAKSPAPEAAPRCGLIVLPAYAAGSDLHIDVLSPAQAAFRLMTCNLNARNLSDGGLAALTALARDALCVTLRYGDYAQLEGVLDTLARLVIDQGFDAQAARRLLSAFSSPSSSPSAPSRSPAMSPVPEPTPPGPRRKLTVGMTTYDDFDGVYFSIQSLRMFHAEALGDAEFLVIDNNPTGRCAAALKALEKTIPNYRYVPLLSRTGTIVRDEVFRQAAGEWVLCIDCHVMFAPGAICKLLDYFEANPETPDLLQGPLIYDDLGTIATHFEPAWRGGMYGYWATDERGRDPGGEPFDIPMQGVGAIACRRSAWPGYHPRLRGFGGEEGYIHEKFRRAGARTLCLPFLRWLHRFPRPWGVPYPVDWSDRMHNYLVGFREVGLPTDDMEAHFRELLGADVANRILAAIEDELVRG